MATVYLDPLKLETKIVRLEAFCSDARGAADFDIKSQYQKDPVESDGGLSSHITAIVNAANTLDERANIIRRDKEKIQQLNSSGIALSARNNDPITFKVPDDSDALDDSDKFQKWAQGAMDANDLRSGESKLPSGRSFDEVMESMKANKGDTTYANSFIDRVGPENLTKIGDRNASLNKEAPVFGEVLATASGTWNEEKAKRNADLIYGSVDEESEWKRIPILNRILGNHDSDGDHINDLQFGTNFLVFLGRRLEQLPHERITNSLKRPPSKDDPFPEKGLEPGHNDPLFGPIDAMTNNGEAAALFFGKNGTEASNEDIDRVRNIAKRYKIGKNKWTDNLAIVSSKMSEYGKIDTREASPEQIELANQAALGTSAILNTVGEEGEKFSAVAASHFGEVLKNYAVGVDHSIQTGGNASGTGVDTYLSGTNIKDAKGTTINSYGQSYWDGVPTQPTFSNFALSNLIGTAGLTEHGLDGLRDKTSVISNARLNYGVQNIDDDTLTASIQLNRRAQGFIAGAIEKKAVENGRNADAEAKKYINLGMKITKYIPGLKEVGDGLANSKTVVQSIGEDSAKSYLEKVFANKEDGAAIEYANYRTSAEAAAERDIIVQLLKSGAISREEVSNWGNKGEAATILNEDGTLNQDALDSTDPEVGADVDRAFIKIQNDFPELADRRVTNAYNAGRITFTSGQDAAKGEMGENNKRVDPNKFGDNAEQMRKQQEEIRKQQEEMKKRQEEER